MSASPSTTTEAQDPTPGAAQRSESPSTVKAMTSSDSSSNPNQEDAMSTDTGSTQSSATRDGTSNGSTSSPNTEDTLSTDSSTQSTTPSSGASNGSTSTTPTKDKKDDKKKKRKVAGRYLSKAEKARAATALERSKNDTRPVVIADREVVQANLDDLQHKQTAVLDCVKAVTLSRGKYEAATVQFKPTLIGALWTLRTQTGGRAFVKSLEGANDVATAKNVISQVPGSTFRLASEVLNELRAGLPAADAASKELDDAVDAERKAAGPYTEALDSLEAAVSMLNGTLNRLKQSQRVKTPTKLQPAGGALLLAKGASARSKKKVV